MFLFLSSLSLFVHVVLLFVLGTEYCGFEYDLDRSFPSPEAMKAFLRAYVREYNRRTSSSNSGSSNSGSSNSGISNSGGDGEEEEENEEFICGVLVSKSISCLYVVCLWLAGLRPASLFLA